MKKRLSLIGSIIFAFVLLFSTIPAACNCEWIETTPVSGDVLNLYGDNPYTLDPALAGDSVSVNYILQIFSGLVTFNDNLEVVPDIAENWEISDDNLKYTFYLKKDVYFHNGENVTARDFKYSWERACNPLTGSQTASMYLGDILGATDFILGRTNSINGVEVINDYTLQITLGKPVNYFLEKLSYPVSFVLDRNNISDGKNWWLKPNGTGPFQLSSWKEGSELVLKRNDNYYGNVAKLDYVVYKIMAGIEFDMYETGEIDVCNVGLSNIYRVTDKDGGFYNQFYSIPELSLMYMCFNCSVPPFDDKNVRRAFAMAIDKQKLVSLVFNDTVTEADGIVPLGTPGYSENIMPLAFDKEQALLLINDSIYGDVANLPEIVITSGGYGGRISTVLEAVINEWQINLGVTVSVRQLEPQVFLYSLAEEKDNVFLWGWSADYPHPQNFLQILFYGGSEGNYGQYVSNDVDNLLRLAAVEQDINQSLKLYAEAEQILIDDAACIPLYFGKNDILVKPYVGGYNLNALGTVKLNEVYLIK
ncbi:MAG: peptide ABC transporter substrate-binding protein [Dehalococcoidales bacterium]